MKAYIIICESAMSGRKTVCTGRVWNSFWSESFPCQVFEDKNVAESELIRVAQGANKHKQHSKDKYSLVEVNL